MTGETLEMIKIKLTLIAIKCPVLLLDMSLQEYGKQHNNISLTQMRNLMADLNINSQYVILRKNTHFVTAIWKLKKKEAFFS